MRKIEKEILNDVANGNLKTHKVRSIIIFITIILTTVMLVGIIMTGSAFYNAQKNYSDISPGPGAKGGAILGGEEEYSKILQYKDVEWAALVKQCSTKRVENPAAMGCNVELLAPDRTFYDNNYVSPEIGTYPEKADEVMISNTFAEKLGIEKKLGEKLTLNVTVLENGKDIKKSFNFTICGYYINPLAMISNDYEEIYSNEEFIKVNNPEISKFPNRIYTKFYGNLNNKEIEQRLNDINNEIDGKGVRAKIDSSDSLSIIVVTSFICIIIILSAYFIICNVFSISVDNDIRYYGMLKTLSVTDKEIRYILNKQINIIMSVSILIGLIIGNIVGRFIAPSILSTMDGLKDFYEPSPIILPSAIIILFLVSTIKISCSQSLRKIKRISPIESRNFVIKKKKNNVFAVTSIVLSCIIFTTVFVSFFGYSIEERVRELATYDFNLLDTAYELIDGSQEFEGIPLELYNEIKNLDYVDNVDILYTANSHPNSRKDSSETGVSYFVKGRIKNSGILKEDYEIAREKGNTFEWDVFDQDLRRVISGVNSDAINRAKRNWIIVDGEIDEDKFDQGNYIIYQNFDRSNEVEAVHAGDKIDIEFYNEEDNKYIEKNVEVMAVIQNEDNHDTSIFSDIGICMSINDFKNLYPNYNELIASIGINTNNKVKMAEQQDEIKQLMNEYSAYQVKFKSKYDVQLYCEKEKNIIILIGGFFSMFFAIIGIASLINSFVSTILSKKIEYARMQAVGMTNNQLVFKFIKEGMKMYIPAVVTFLPIETGILIYAKKLFSNYLLFGQSVLMIIITFMLISIIIAISLVKIFNKKSIVERLREVE
ncbi:MAG: FtsX-like permease family protein [Clostridium sp.]